MPAPPFFFSPIATPDSFHRQNATAGIWLVITPEFYLHWSYEFLFITISRFTLLACNYDSSCNGRCNVQQASDTRLKVPENIKEQKIKKTKPGPVNNVKKMVRN
jgi:hypothetical protein